MLTQLSGSSGSPRSINQTLPLGIGSTESSWENIRPDPAHVFANSDQPSTAMPLEVLDLREEKYSQIPLEMVLMLKPDELPVQDQKRAERWRRKLLQKRMKNPMHASQPRRRMSIDAGPSTVMRGPKYGSSIFAARDTRCMPDDLIIQFLAKNLSHQALLDAVLFNTPLISPHTQARLSIHTEGLGSMDRASGSSLGRSASITSEVRSRQRLGLTLQAQGISNNDEIKKIKTKMNAQREDFDILRKNLVKRGDALCDLSVNHFLYEQTFKDYYCTKQKMLVLQEQYLRDSCTIIQNYIDSNAYLTAFCRGFEGSLREQLYKANEAISSMYDHFAKPKQNSSQPASDEESARKNRTFLVTLFPQQEAAKLVETVSHAVTLMKQALLDPRLSDVSQKNFDGSFSEATSTGAGQKQLKAAHTLGTDMGHDIALHFSSPAALHRLGIYQNENGLRPSRGDSASASDSEMDIGSQLAYLLWDYSHHRRWGSTLIFHPQYFVYPSDMTMVLQMELVPAHAELVSAHTELTSAYSDAQSRIKELEKENFRLRNLSISNRPPNEEIF
jgi:hypothetical protein